MWVFTTPFTRELGVLFGFSCVGLPGMTAASVPDATGFDPSKLIAAHQAGVWRYLRALGCEPSLADDLTQETFLSVLQVPFKEINPAATSSYLRRTAFNTFISYHRRARRMVTMDDVEVLDREWTKWAGDDGGEAMLDALRTCLQGLGARAKLALDLRFRERVSRVGIAQQLKMSENGAKNLMQRAKQKLRDCIRSKLE